MKRRGFTLIELMVVIAIIIILAAIAIPNYLSMTARAKRSRVASDFAAIATALETYRTDWNQYPKGAALKTAEQISGTGIAAITGNTFAELTGNALASTNQGTTAAGETAPIQYMTASILKSMINPYSNLQADQYKYTSGSTGAGTTPTHWLLTATTVASGSGNVFLSRTDETPSVSGPSAIGTVPAD
jgi:prepilin-type N-terminal cleavage/methylation domain-containing protein